MTQFGDQYQQYGQGYAEPPEPVRTSRMAVASLICSLVICCPLATLIGPFLGLAAVVSITANPETRKGKGLAIAGIIIGLLVTAIWGIVAYWGITISLEMQRALRERPPQSMQQAFDGDSAQFRDHFTSQGANATDQEIQAFVDELRSRYGEFVSMTYDEEAFRQNPPSMDEMMSPVHHHPFEIEFENATLSAEVGVTMQGPQTDQPIWGDVRIEEIVIRDPEQGDVTFPPTD